MSNIVIKIGSIALDNWKSVSVTRSIESLCGTFSISLYDNKNQILEILSPNSKVDIYVDDYRIMRGYIEKFDAFIDRNESLYDLSGRDCICDIVDSSSIIKPGKWNETTLYNLALSLCKPFSVTVKKDLDINFIAFPFKLQSGESPFEALNRANEFQGALLLVDENSNLLITKVGNNVFSESLSYGNNILNAKFAVNYADRFSEYTVIGQRKIKNSSGWEEKTVNFSATAEDKIFASTKRYRPKVLQSEAPTSQKGAQNRANLEASVRAAKTRTLSITTNNWTQRSGALWAINNLVNIDIPKLGFYNNLMLLSSITYSKDLRNGSLCSMQFRRKDAFQPLINNEIPPIEDNKLKW